MTGPIDSSAEATVGNPHLPASVAGKVELVSTLTPFEHGVIDIFVHLTDVLSVPKSVGEIYGLLFASPRPLAFQDIIDRLHISKGSASQGLSMLRAVGAIKLIYVAGDRRDHFESETELRTLLSGFLKERIKPHLENGAVRIKALKDVSRAANFANGNPEELKILRGRIEKLGSWHKKGKMILPMAAKFFG